MPTVPRQFERLDEAIHIEFLRKSGVDMAWYQAPSIVESGSGLVLIDLASPTWAVQPFWLRQGLLCLRIRSSTDNTALALVLDTQTHAYQLFDANGPIEIPQ
jgi:hypothetical protein